MEGSHFCKAAVLKYVHMISEDFLWLLLKSSFLISQLQYFICQTSSYPKSTNSFENRWIYGTAVLASEGKHDIFLNDTY